jgi:uncharacterized protein (DUF1800 family)
MKKTLLFFMLLSFVATISLLKAQQTITFGLGNFKNVTVAASSNDNSGINTLQTSGFLPNQNAASRFLSQATLGKNISQIQNVATIGIESWVNTQMNLPNSFSVQNYVLGIHQSIVDSLLRDSPAGGYTLANTNVSDWHFDIAWFQGAMTASDVLRWRVGLALSEIFVTSRNSSFEYNPYALANYYDMLMNNAFGNYRTLLENITYHPAMGDYLTFLNNHATDIADGRQVYPDENYAREIMQLFSIGLYKLNIDGTEQKDANNKSIPTYDNNDIAGLAKVFTGLSYGDARYLGDSNKDYWSYTKRMKFFGIDSSDAKRNTWKTNPRIVNGHEPGGKSFLGQTIPNRPVLQGELDIQDALNVIYNHPNVGPFLSRRLIQRLISSNPSPDYIQRVATIFNNNGSGVRGDLKAVIKAILLDPEARDNNPDDNSNYAGMLREPFIRYMNLMRGLKLTTTGGVYRNVLYNVYDRLDQIPMASNTVFNFFQPDYQPDGDLKIAGKYAPEFQLLNSQTLTNYFNALNEWVVRDNPTNYWSYFGSEKNKEDQNPSFDLRADNILTKNNRLAELLDKYNLILAHGRLSASSIAAIKTVILGIPLREDSLGVPNEDDAYLRIRMAIYLMMSSPDYLINR